MANLIPPLRRIENMYPTKPLKPPTPPPEDWDSPLVLLSDIELREKIQRLQDYVASLVKLLTRPVEAPPEKPLFVVEVEVADSELAYVPKYTANKPIHKGNK
jgi:hypothetical protein